MSEASRKEKKRKEKGYVPRVRFCAFTLQGRDIVGLLLVCNLDRKRGERFGGAEYPVLVCVGWLVGLCIETVGYT